MEENQNIYLPGYDLVLCSFYCTGQNDQEEEIELYSSDAGFVALLLWEVDSLRDIGTELFSMPQSGRS
jgi:hypothetical protein